MARCLHCGKSNMFLKINELGWCWECISSEKDRQLSNALSESATWKKKFEDLNQVITPEVREITDLDKHLLALKSRIAEAEKTLSTLNEQIIIAGDAVEMESFSLYRPTYDFISSDEYKAHLDQVRSHQKDMLKNGTAATCSIEWTVNGSKSEGRKQTNDSIKLFLRAFNLECESATREVKYSNFDRCQQRIENAFEQINKLGRVNKISISRNYLVLKLSELKLAHEYALKKQQEKEYQTEIRRQQREQAKLDKEIAEARKAVEKERQHYEQALAKIDAQIFACHDDVHRAELQVKRAEINDGLHITEAKLEDIDYRQSNQRAGYVYIISNIGSFGENVYKIGMTRRLDPMERINELGDASVPFAFDVHAMIFSADAPALETALHHAFEDRRLNKINLRREYFRVTLDEIKDVIRKHHDNSVEFIDIPNADQYRQSLIM